MLNIILGTTTEGVKIAVQSIFIDPCKSATIKYKFITINKSVEQHEYIMDGEQYSRWGTDDTILYHILCARHNVQYRPFVEPEFLEEVIVWKDEATNEIKSEVVKKSNPKYVSPSTPTPAEPTPTPAEPTPTPTEPTPTPAEPTPAEPTPTHPEPTPTEPTPTPTEPTPTEPTPSQ